MKNKILLLAFGVLTIINARGQITPSSTYVCVGSTTTLGLLPGTPSGGTWSSSAPALATVDGSGVVTGVAVGTSTPTSITITYNDGTTPHNCGIRVVPTVIGGDKRICVSYPTNSFIMTGGSAPDGHTWSSSNTAVATIGTSGANTLITAVSPGTTTISYTNGTYGCTSSVVVTVSANGGTIEGPSSVCVGSSTTLTNATSGGTWSCNFSPTYAAIGQNTGIITGNTAKNFITVTYTLNSHCSAIKSFNVVTTADTISGPGSLCVGSTISLSSTTGGGTWSSTNTGVATVGLTTGIVTGQGAGTALISYKGTGTCYSTKIVTVLATPGAITGVDSLCEDDIVTMSATPSGGTWSSDNTSAATIDASGIVTTPNLETAICSLYTTITYSLSSGCYSTKSLKVNDRPEGFTEAPTARLCRQESVKIQPNNGTGTIGGCYAGHEWQSSNPLIADVPEVAYPWHVVAGSSAGTATISYSSGNNCWITHIVTVNPPTTDTITSSLRVINGNIPVCATGTTTLTCTDANSTSVWTQLTYFDLLTIDSQTPIVSGQSKAVIKGLTANRNNVANIKYTVNLGTTDERCSIKSLKVYEASAPITPMCIGGDYTVCVGRSLSLTNAAYNGEWKSSDPSIATVYSNDNHNGIVQGVMTGTVTISYRTGCDTVTQVVTVTPPCTPPACILARFSGDNGSTPGINTVQGQAQQYSIFPNPNRGSFAISKSSSQNSDVKVRIINYTGAIVYADVVPLKNGKADLNLEKLPAGMYLLSLIDESGNLNAFKMVIDK